MLQEFLSQVNATVQAQLQAAEVARLRAGQPPSQPAAPTRSSLDETRLNFGITDLPPQHDQQAKGLWTPNGEEAKKDQVAAAFTRLVNTLEEEQIDYDIGCEDVIKRVGNVRGKEFHVGAAHYRTVVLPPGLENLDESTVLRLAEFALNGGEIVSLDANFSLVGGRAFEALDESQAPIKRSVEIVQKALSSPSLDDLINESRKMQPVAVLPSSNAENIFHQLRETEDALILFICNIDMDEKATGRLALNGAWQNAKIENFDAESGEVQTYNETSFTLGPCESATFVLSKVDGKLQNKDQKTDPPTLTSQALLDMGALTSIVDLVFGLIKFVRQFKSRFVVKLLGY